MTPSGPRPSPVIGDLDHGGILLLAAQLLDTGSWRYTYSIRPGVTVSVITRPGPDTPDPLDPVWLEVIPRGNAATAPAPRLAQVPDP